MVFGVTAMDTCGSEKISMDVEFVACLSVLFPLLFHPRSLKDVQKMGCSHPQSLSCPLVNMQIVFSDIRCRVAFVALLAL